MKDKRTRRRSCLLFAHRAQPTELRGRRRRASQQSDRRKGKGYGGDDYDEEEDDQCDDVSVPSGDNAAVSEREALLE